MGRVAESDWREQKITGKRTKVAHLKDGGFVDRIVGALHSAGLPEVSSGEAQAGIDVTYPATGASTVAAPAVAAPAVVEPAPKTMTYDEAQALTRQHNAEIARSRAQRTTYGSAFASGGAVRGPGTGTSDSIPARLSDGEYVLPADTVRAVGKNKLDALRAATHAPTGMLKMANGGVVVSNRSMAPKHVTPDPVAGPSLDTINRWHDEEAAAHAPASTPAATTPVTERTPDTLVGHIARLFSGKGYADGGVVDDSLPARIGNAVGGTMRTLGTMVAGAPKAIVDNYDPLQAQALRSGAGALAQFSHGVDSLKRGFGMGMEGVGIPAPAEPAAPATPAPTVAAAPSTPAVASLPNLSARFSGSASSSAPVVRAPVDTGAPQATAPSMPTSLGIPGVEKPTVSPQIDVSKAYTDARNALDTGGIAGFAGARSILGAAQKTSGMINQANEQETARTRVANEAPIAAARNKTEGDIANLNSETHIADTNTQTAAHLKGIGMQTQAELERQRLANSGAIAHAQASQPRMTAVMLDPTRQGVVINDANGVHVVDPAQHLAQQQLESQISAAPPEKQGALRQLTALHGVLGDAEFQKRVKALLGS